jgi:hypothetical protein
MEHEDDESDYADGKIDHHEIPAIECCLSMNST